MHPPFIRLAGLVLTLPFLAACGDNGTKEAQAAATETPSAAPLVRAASLTTAAPGAGQDSPAPRLAALPRQIRDYHQTTYVDECRSFENSTLTVREPGYVTTADFNGDGRPDYVLSGTHLECSAGASYICGNGTCPFDMFLSQGDGFTMVNAVGHEGELTRQGGSPAFMVTAKSGQVNRLGPAAAAGGNSAPAATGGNQASAAGQAITLNVTLTPAARAAFARTGERVVVKVFYSGDAKASYTGDDLDEMGDLNLGSVEQTLTPIGGQAVLDGSGINRAALAHLNGPAQVRVTVWGSGASYLDCEVQGSVANLSQRPQSMNCDIAR